MLTGYCRKSRRVCYWLFFRKTLQSVIQTKSNSAPVQRGNSIRCMCNTDNKRVQYVLVAEGSFDVISCRSQTAKLQLSLFWDQQLDQNTSIRIGSAINFLTSISNPISIFCKRNKQCLFIIKTTSKTAKSWVLLVNIYKLLSIKRLLAVDCVWCWHRLKEIYLSLFLLPNV